MKTQKVLDENDAEAELALYHDDWEFKLFCRNIMKNGDISEEMDLCITN